MYQEKLKQVQNELTQTEKIIADFFQNHSLEARSFTSYQLADRLNIGQSTIIRFSKKLGYRSFRELLEDLSTSLTEEKSRRRLSSMRAPRQPIRRSSSSIRKWRS